MLLGSNYLLILITEMGHPWFVSGAPQGISDLGLHRAGTDFLFKEKSQFKKAFHSMALNSRIVHQESNFILEVIVFSKPPEFTRVSNGFTGRSDPSLESWT